MLRSNEKFSRKWTKTSVSQRHLVGGFPDFAAEHLARSSCAQNTFDGALEASV